MCACCVRAVCVLCACVLCVCVCEMCVCVHVHACKFVCMRCVCMRMHVSLCMYMCVWVGECVCMSGKMETAPVNRTFFSFISIQQTSCVWCCID